jgi:hypothetical protein
MEPMESRMDIEQYLQQVLDSQGSDWLRLHTPVFLQNLQTVESAGNVDIEVDQHFELITLKSNLDISLANGLTHRKSFVEPWTRRFPDPSASSTWIDLLWRGRPILRVLQVHVDGARAALPMPIPGTLNVPDRQVTLFRLLDSVWGTGDFDRYFQQAKFTAIPHPWPNM